MEGEKATESFNEWMGTNPMLNKPIKRMGNGCFWRQQEPSSGWRPLYLSTKQPWRPSNPKTTLDSQTIPSQSSSSAVYNVKAEEIAGSDLRSKVVRNGFVKLLRSGGSWIASRVRYHVICKGGFCSSASLAVLVSSKGGVNGSCNRERTVSSFLTKRETRFLANSITFTFFLKF